MAMDHPVPLGPTLRTASNGLALLCLSSNTVVRIPGVNPELQCVTPSSHTLLGCQAQLGPVCGVAAFGTT